LVLAALAVFGAAACNDNSQVVPTGIVGNDFAVRWQIASNVLGGQIISCAQAGATAVVETVIKTDTGVVLTSRFDCNAYQGLSAQLAAGGNYDIQLDLVNPANAVLSTVSITNQNITINGTVDLGLVTFQVP
jgi:hypothetical protein